MELKAKRQKQPKKAYSKFSNESNFNDSIGVYCEYYIENAQSTEQTTKLTNFERSMNNLNDSNQTTLLEKIASLDDNYYLSKEYNNISETVYNYNTLSTNYSTKCDSFVTIGNDELMQIPDKTFKVMLIGDKATGKSVFVHKICEKSINSQYAATQS